MTLLESLVADLFSCLNGYSDAVPRRVLLWLDPGREFGRLAPHLGDSLAARGAKLQALPADNGSSQVTLKLDLLRFDREAAPESEPRCVVYLPGWDPSALEPGASGAAPKLWAVYEYRFTGGTFSLDGANADGANAPGLVRQPPTLLQWMEAHGVQIVDATTSAALTSGGADSLLARYAELKRDEALEAWPRPLKLSEVRDALAGDPRDALKALFASPSNEVDRWGDTRPLVLGRIEGEYGLSPPDGEVPAEALADALALQLALSEAWDAFGGTDDFPFLARIPASLDHRRRGARLLRDDLLGHLELGPLFYERMRRLETSIDLGDWARGRTGQPAALPLLASRRWEGFISGLRKAAQGGWRTARDYLLAERESVAAGAASPAERLDGDVHWSVAADARQLCEEAATATAQATMLKSAASFVQSYAQDWWQLDRLHRRVLAAAAAGPGLDELRSVADAAYFDCVSALNDGFSALVEQGQAWPPADTRAVESLRSVLWSAGRQRRAVVIVDACRWEIAQETALLFPEGDCELEPAMATLPSETAFGMAAHLPLDGLSLSVDLAGAQVSIQEPGGPNLATRDGRKAFLRQALVNDAGKPLVDFVDLAALLKGAVVPSTPLVVVMDNTIDEQGHKGTGQLPGLVLLFAANLKRAIDRLHAAGVTEVHVVADHGFLLLPPELVEALGTPTVLVSQCYSKDSRWAALKPGAPVADLIKLPLPLAPSVTLGFPRGLRTLVKPSPFLHGGISLQECVIPHLVSRRSLARARPGLDLHVTDTHLSTGTIPVILKAVPPPGQAPLGGLEPLKVRLTVEVEGQRSGDGHKPLYAAGPVEIEVEPEHEARPALYLKEGLALRTGQGLVLRAVDVNGERDLGTIALTLARDWD